MLLRSSPGMRTASAIDTSSLFSVLAVFANFDNSIKGHLFVARAGRLWYIDIVVHVPLRRMVQFLTS